MQSYLIVGIFSQVFLKLRKDSVCFSSLTLAMMAVITLVLITKIEVTTGQPQKTMYFTRFQGEREKKNKRCCSKESTKHRYLAGYTDSIVQTQKQRLQCSCIAIDTQVRFSLELGLFMGFPETYYCFGLNRVRDDSYFHWQSPRPEPRGR